MVTVQGPAIFRAQSHVPSELGCRYDGYDADRLFDAERSDLLTKKGPMMLESMLTADLCRVGRRLLIGDYGLLSLWIAVGLLAMVCQSSTASETGSLKMRFVFESQPPAPERINLPPGFPLAAGSVQDEKLLVSPESKGIKNVVVYVYTGRNGTKLDLPPAKNQKRRLVMANGRFAPHILIAQAGDTLEMIQRGPLGYNANLHFFANNPQGMIVAPGQNQEIHLAKPEPAPIPVECNIHPWMRAYVVILDHPFAAVSDRDGSLTIKGLPIDRPLIFRVFHESLLIRNVTIAGEDIEWKKNRFEFKLKPGENDLGDIMVPAESLDR